MIEVPNHLDSLAKDVVDGAFQAHRTLGPGLLESVYEQCLTRELAKRGLGVKRQVAVPVTYDGEVIDSALKLDLLVEDKIIVEIKAVEKIAPLHMAQLLTYLKLSGRRLGFLINFNVPLIRDGISRLAL
ncbi:GxxExxY protein [Paramagnetospirillum kuznetsovii]|uniref:GxxExxY protein n=1 Tax=Paramagnetospirillum kuznetsovii TaxID=2053833 RepID=A0A364P0H2_9PROT|nr:GxxExxY protein [Paramagnetospirillum kuznetsovii]RAU22803.1 GxxExxY protein [Paramagnetospirillum kuznetsovii]